MESKLYVLESSTFAESDLSSIYIDYLIMTKELLLAVIRMGSASVALKNTFKSCRKMNLADSSNVFF